MKIILITSDYHSLIRHILANPNMNIIGLALAGQEEDRLPFLIQARHQLYDTYHRRLRGIPLPVFYLKKDRQEVFADWVKKMRPDLMIIYSCPFLIQKEIFEQPPLGTINLHASSLPGYRGPQPLLWQYLNYDLNCGMTIHYLNEKEDSGDIIEQQAFSIELGCPYSKTLALLESKGYKLLLNIVRQIEQGKAVRIKQPEQSHTRRAKRLNQTEIKNFIQWEEWPVEQVFHCLRGIRNISGVLPDHPTLNAGQRLIVTDYSKQVPAKRSAAEIIKGRSGYLLICSNGIIKINKQLY